MLLKAERTTDGGPGKRRSEAAANPSLGKHHYRSDFSRDSGRFTADFFSTPERERNKPYDISREFEHSRLSDANVSRGWRIANRPVVACKQESGESIAAGLTQWEL